MNHNLLKIPGGWECSCCLWKWSSKPLSECPGIPRYSWENKPACLQTKTQLGKQGLKLSPNQQVRGIVQSGDGKQWWELYDARETIAKQKKSPPSKSTRPPCPIGLDCLLVAAKVGKPCPNKEYCASLARPWKLPYQISQLPSGTRLLEVAIASYSETERIEKTSAGFEKALPLPYKFIADDRKQPVLCVTYTSGEQESAGWLRATPLPSDYLMWVAVKQGISYQDFRETDWSDRRYMHWTQIQQDYYREWESTVIEYPHCILPPRHCKPFTVEPAVS